MVLGSFLTVAREGWIVHLALPFTDFGGERPKEVSMKTMNQYDGGVDSAHAIRVTTLVSPSIKFAIKMPLNTLKRLM